MSMDNSRAKIGLLLFLASEVMFFSGLLSAFWVLRSQLPLWPPMGQPRFPVAVTGVNTAILLLSAVTFLQAERLIASGAKGNLPKGNLPNLRMVVRWLGLTFSGGLLFLLIQGYEWARLIHFGLETERNVYGALFYIVIGAHAFHVLVALLVVGFILIRARRGSYSAHDHEGITLGRIYWIFVVLVWPAIYVSLYLI